MTATEKFSTVTLIALFAWIWSDNVMNLNASVKPVQVLLSVMLIGCGLMLVSGRAIRIQTSSLAEKNRKEREALEAEFPALKDSVDTLK